MQQLKSYINTLSKEALAENRTNQSVMVSLALPLDVSFDVSSLLVSILSSFTFREAVGGTRILSITSFDFFQFLLLTLDS